MSPLIETEFYILDEPLLLPPHLLQANGQPIPGAPPPKRSRILMERPVPTFRAEEDLRRYLGSATLPNISRYDRRSPYCLPHKGRKTHKNKLRVRHHRDRRIVKIWRHERKAFDNATHLYHKYYTYGRGKRPFAGKHYTRQADERESLVLSARRCVPEATRENIPYPNNIDETYHWLRQYTFKTLQRAVHLAHPDTMRWWLDDADTVAPQPAPDVDRNIWRTYLWRFHPDEHQQTWWREVPNSENGNATEPAPHESMVFAIQPHWILGPEDIKDFTECKGLPAFSDDGTPPETPLTSSERVWAKLHDTCKRHNCRTFALTTYHGWVFGKFSEDWTSARISEVKEHNAYAPTVIQSLVYWVASSMGLAGAKEPRVVEDAGQ